MTSISAAIITYNEERNIKRCLDSLVGVVDEIVVVDSGSKDKTKEICESYSLRFLVNPFEGHIQQKNYALSQTSHAWVLSLDADEALSEELRQNILQAKSNGLKDFYEMNRLTNYCGKWIKHCGWYPDKKLRLFNKEKGKWTGLNPHDRFDAHEKNASVQFIKGDLLHYSYYTSDEHYKQIEYFSSIAAQAYFEKGKKGGLIMQIISPIAKFLRHYVVKLGVLDGKAGFQISCISAYATWLKYKKLNKFRLINKKHAH